MANEDPKKFADVKLTPATEDFIADSQHIREADKIVRRAVYKLDKEGKKTDEVEEYIYGRTEQELRDHADTILRQLLIIDDKTKEATGTTELGTELTYAIADMMGRDRENVYIDYDKDIYDAKLMISIVDDSNEKNGKTPSEDILDVDLSGLDVGGLLRKTVLEMGLVNQQLEQADEITGFDVSYVRDVSGNDYITKETHINQFKQGNFKRMEQRPKALVERVSNTWQGYRNSYKWLIDSSELGDKIKAFYGDSLREYDSPGYWLQVADYVNSTSEDTSNFDSEDYMLGDFFEYLRNNHIRTKDLTNDELEQVYQLWRQGTGEGYLEQLRAQHPDTLQVEVEDKAKAQMNLNAILGRVKIRTRTSSTQDLMNKRNNHSMIPSKIRRDKKPK